MRLVNPEFWRGRSVFVTGHTGFKGSWLLLWLGRLGAEVTGYALEPHTEPSLFRLASVGAGVRSIIGDVRDPQLLTRSMVEAKPEVVLHLAAQALVRPSYEQPLDTFAVNVLGTANVLDAVRTVPSVRAAVVITTDKVYENREWLWPYREDEALGGYDPYSASKACAELVTSSYRSSYFTASPSGRAVGVATARAGNVIGGGDWAQDRLLPDCVRALLTEETIQLRYPDAVRPWQHVLEPLAGYLRLAECLCQDPHSYAGAWNFGPTEEDARPVRWIVDRVCKGWKGSKGFSVLEHAQPHEAAQLRLESSKARAKLGWRPTWSLERAIDSIIDWFSAYQAGCDMKLITLGQIEDFTASMGTQANPCC